VKALKKARELLRNAGDSTSAASSSFINKTRDRFFFPQDVVGMERENMKGKQQKMPHIDILSGINVSPLIFEFLLSFSKCDAMLGDCRNLWCKI